MTEPIEPTPAELERAASQVRAHEHATALAALCFDLVSRQAEGRVLYTGERFVAARAEEHGVDAKMAETALGSVLTALERGPETPVQWALICAFYVRGLIDICEGKLGEERAIVLSRFVAHADWLEASTPHRPLALARALLPAALACELADRLASAVLKDDVAEASPSVRGRNALRLAALTALAEQSDPSAAEVVDAARRALARVDEKAVDPWSRSLARARTSQPAAEGASGVSAASSTRPSAAKLERTSGAGTTVRIAGVLSRAPRPSWSSPLRWLTGFALLRWGIASIAALLGVRRHAIVELQGRSLCVRIATRWLGRTVRSSEVVHGLEHVAAVRRIARYASLHLLLGVTLFAGGALLGGYLLRDGLRTQDRTLLLAGAGLVFGGALLDLVLSVLVPATARRVRVELDLGDGGRVDVSGVPASEADVFMHALRDQVSG